MKRLGLILLFALLLCTNALAFSPGTNTAGLTRETIYTSEWSKAFNTNRTGGSAVNYLFSDTNIIDELIDILGITNGDIVVIQPQISPAVLSNRLQVLFDQDFNSDCGDASAVVLMLGLDRAGYTDTLGIGISTGVTNRAAQAMRAITDYYGRPDIEIGTNNTAWSYGNRTGMDDVMATNYFPAYNPNAYHGMTNVIGLYRRKLAAASTNSVHILIGGQLKNLRDLWYSAPDSYSSLAGSNLIASRSVRR